MCELRTNLAVGCLVSSSSWDKENGLGARRCTPEISRILIPKIVLELFNKVTTFSLFRALENGAQHRSCDTTLVLVLSHPGLKIVGTEDPI